MTLKLVKLKRKYVIIIMVKMFLLKNLIRLILLILQKRQANDKLKTFSKKVTSNFKLTNLTDTKLHKYQKKDMILCKVHFKKMYFTYTK